MGNGADGKRTGHGFLALRKRYIRRAEFLSTDQPFHARVEGFRAEWNDDYPQFRVGLGYPVAPSGLPAALDTACAAYDLAYAEAQNAVKEAERAGSDREAMRIPMDAYVELMRSPERQARNRWFDATSDIAREFFPLEDFPNPFPNLPYHPAWRFIAQCLHSHPRLILDAAGFIPEMSLEPVDLFPYEEDADVSKGEPISDGDLLWYLPLYPGITEADIRRAAPAIVERVNGIYGTRTASARVVALREEGLTYRQIADRLGLTEQTVAATLKGAGMPTTEDV